MENFKDYVKKAFLKESVEELSQRAKSGTLVTSWRSSTRKDVRHTIYYLPKENSFYQVSGEGNDVLEVKIIDVNNLTSYKSWFHPEIYSKLENIIKG